MGISTPDDLRTHVEAAIDVELSTIPPYLYALYSIDDPASEPAQLIRSVATEEMLHVALATNLLLALGGEPEFASPHIVPQYPAPMKHHQPELMLDLAPCSPDVVRNVFMVIERPESHAPPPDTDRYETLGQFYHALEVAIEAIDDGRNLFATPQRERQMADPSFYSPVAYDTAESGGLQLIDDVASACAAIEVIVHQGEGLSEARWADPLHQELTHFHKFKLIADGGVPMAAVRPAPTNPRTEQYPAHIQPVSDLFNALYRSMFLTMDALFGPKPAKAALVRRLYSVMSGLMGPVARFLLEQPIAGGLVAAPTFEVFEFTSDDPASELAALAATVAGLHPELAPVAEQVNALT